MCRNIFKNMNENIKIFKSLSDMNRIRILKMLDRKPLCVCEITSILDISTSTVSSHLSYLKDAGFIYDNKNGKWVDYYMRRTSENPILNQLLVMLSAWMNDDETIKNDLEKLEFAYRGIICSGKIQIEL